MRIFVIGLDCAEPSVMFQHPGLPNLKALMSRGCYGRLESVIPPITVPAWMCMSTSQDPGSLGIYGFRNRTDHSYDQLGVANATWVKEKAIWDHLNARGKQAIVVGVPPSYPPPAIQGVRVGCFLTPDTKSGNFATPQSVQAEIAQVLDGAEYPVDVRGFRTENKPWLRDQIYDMSRKHFKVIRHLMTTRDWDYFHFVEIGLDRIHHGFWKYHDPAHRQYEAGSPLGSVVRDYYVYLDEEIGTLLELLDDDTLVLVVSDHGAQRLDGGFCVNEWLVREGLLVLKEKPAGLTPFSPKLVDWTKTKVWSEGGYYARIFCNVEGREPNGVIPASQLDAFLADLTKRLEALPDDQGKPMNSLVFRPNEIYKHVRNVAPDLIVHFGGLFWRSIGRLGDESLYIQENDTGPDDCNHAQFGLFILAGPGVPANGETSGARLLDIAPTLLSVAGESVPASMQGRNFLS